MSVSYLAIQWNRQKKRYDLMIWSGIMGYIFLFFASNILLNPEITEETLLIRSTGTLAILMLHIILLIGPLSRLNPKFLPLLYNRRHLGVSMFLIALVHGTFAAIQFHALSNEAPLISIFTSNVDYTSLSNFPFQTLGVLALLILFLMAATSHDFWLANLSPRIWKSLHMMVYLAYLLLIFHVLLGIVQSDPAPVLVLLLGIGSVVVVASHVMAALKESKLDRSTAPGLNSDYRPAGDHRDIPDNGAFIVNFGEERIAIFKYDGKLSAVSNVCCHQNGPLGEGRIIDGLITCPWHGFQYRPHDGCAPEPFKEKVSTYDLQLDGFEIRINPRPHPPGTKVPPLKILNQSP